MMLHTVSRAVELLRALAEHPQGLTLTELTRAMRSNKATVHRLVQTLRAFNLITAAGADRLRLGPGLLTLADAVFREVDVREISRPHLRWLRDRTGETACLHLAFGHERACVDQVESRAEIKWVAEIGKKFPITAGAPGKVLLAFRSPEQRERLLKAVPLLRLAPRSVTDRGRYERELAQVTRDGYAFSVNESVPGAAACAAPIFDRTGAVVGAVTVAGPVERLSRRRMRSYSPLVRLAADRISRELRSRASPGAH